MKALHIPSLLRVFPQWFTPLFINFLSTLRLRPFLKNTMTSQVAEPYSLDDIPDDEPAKQSCSGSTAA
jgi:hypothetical protein